MIQAQRAIRSSNKLSGSTGDTQVSLRAWGDSDMAGTCQGRQRDLTQLRDWVLAAVSSFEHLPVFFPFAGGKKCRKEQGVSGTQLERFSYKSGSKWLYEYRQTLCETPACGKSLHNHPALKELWDESVLTSETRCFRWLGLNDTDYLIRVV